MTSSIINYYMHHLPQMVAPCPYGKKIDTSKSTEKNTAIYRNTQNRSLASTDTLAKELQVARITLWVKVQANYHVNSM